MKMSENAYAHNTLFPSISMLLPVECTAHLPTSARMATFQRTHNIDKQYMTCPYDPSHRVPSNRMPYHLVGCERRSARVLLFCPFNASHRVDRSLMPEHMSHCPDQCNVIGQLIDLDPKPNTVCSRLPNAGQQAVDPNGDNKVKAEKRQESEGPEEPEENWD